MNIRQRKEIHSALAFSLYGKTQIRAAQPLECRITMRIPNLYYVNTETGVRIKKAPHENSRGAEIHLIHVSSIIRTIPSAPESHRISAKLRSRAYAKGIYRR